MVICVGMCKKLKIYYIKIPTDLVYCILYFLVVILEKIHNKV